MFEEKRRMEIICDVISERFDIPVHLVEDGPSAAWYDGKVLSLSRIKIKDMMKKMDDKCIKYLLYHESAHALLSDMGVVETLEDHAKRSPIDHSHTTHGITKDSANILLSFTQSLEDVRIENEISNKYEGVKTELDSRLDDVVGSNKETLKEQMSGINPRSIGLGALLKYRKKKFYDELASPELKKIMDSKEVEEVTDRIKTAKSSWDVFQIAKDLYLQTKKYIKTMEMSPPCISEALGEGGDSDKEREKSEKKNKGKGEEKEGSSGEGGSGEKDEKKSKEKEGKGSGDTESKNTKEDTEDKIKDFEKELKKQIDYKAKQPKSTATTTELPSIPKNWDVEFSLDDTYPILSAAKAGDQIKVIKNKDIATYDHIRSEINGYIRVLQRKIKDMFTLKTKSHYEAGHSSGKLISTKDLWKICNNTDKVFMKRYKEQNSDYAITVLIDQSGSMGGGKIHEAQKSFILLAEILSDLKIPFELLGFSTQGEAYGHSRGEIRCDEYRQDHTLHMIYKQFDERYSDEIKGRIGSIHTYGNNWDGEAVMWAYKRLIVQKAKSKILIVLSDGQPSGDSSNRRNCSFTKSVVRSVQKRVKTIGIGYQSESPKQFYKNYVIVNEVKELPVVFCKLLYRVLNTKA